MGLDSNFFKSAEDLLSVNSGVWVKKQEGLCKNTAPPGPGMSKKPTAVVVDAPGYLYKTWMIRENKPPYTINDLAKCFADKLLVYLNNLNIEMVVMLWDKKTPVNKSVKRRPDSSTPKTPLHRVSSDFVGNSEQRAEEAWQQVLSDNQDRSDRQGLRVSASSDVHPGDFILPANYHDHLKNRDFKRYLSKAVTKLMLEQIVVPQGKRLVICDSRFCMQKVADQITVPAEKFFMHSYWEADNSGGYWAAALCEEYDVDFDSEDSDLILNLLLGSHLRLKPESTVGTANRNFRNTVRLLRKQWDKHSTEIININDIYVDLQYVHACLQRRFQIAVCNPIGNFGLLWLMQGSDYTNSSLFHGVSARVLLETYLVHFGEFANNLVSSHTSNASTLRVDPHAFARLVMRCFSRVRGNTKISVPADTVQRFFGVIEPHYKDKRDKMPTPEKIRAMLANCTWTLSYFACGSYFNKHHPDPMVRMGNRSIYGYQYSSDGLVEFTKNTTLAGLLEMHSQSRTTPDSEQYLQDLVLN
jgi:hypothetical protein